MEGTHFFMAAYYVATVTLPEEDLKAQCFDWCEIPAEDREGLLTMGIQIFDGRYALDVEFMYDPSKLATEVAERTRVTLDRVLRKHMGDKFQEVQLVGMQSCGGGPVEEKEEEVVH